MTVAKLGDIIFTVSDTVLKTLQSAVISRNATINQHQRHLKSTMPEFTGYEAFAFSTSFRSSRHLGAEPLKDIETIDKYVKNGTQVALTIGKKSFGRWLVQSYKANFMDYDKNSTPIDAEITVSLKEYPEG